MNRGMASSEIINESVRQVWIARVRKIKETAGGARGGYVTVNGRLDPRPKLQHAISAPYVISARSRVSALTVELTVIFLHRRTRAHAHSRNRPVTGNGEIVQL